MDSFPKEVYEPFWEDLVKTSGRIAISSKWMADRFFQGKSARLNEKILGNDPHWLDYSRDVLAMNNEFRDQMGQPPVAVGHSMGADQAVALLNFTLAFSQRSSP